MVEPGIEPGIFLFQPQTVTRTINTSIQKLPRTAPIDVELWENALPLSHPTGCCYDL
jgi:hypothetical protein